MTRGDGTVGLAWSAPVSNGGFAITAYRVYRGTSSGGETLLTTLGAVTSFTDNGVTNGTAYFYKVSAVNTVGEGPLSNEISITPGTVPSAPVLTSTAGNAAVGLAWTPGANGGLPVTGYRIYRALQSGPETLVGHGGRHDLHRHDRRERRLLHLPRRCGERGRRRREVGRAHGDPGLLLRRRAVRGGTAPATRTGGIRLRCSRAGPAWARTSWGRRTSACRSAARGPAPTRRPTVPWARTGVAVPEWDASELAFRFLAQVYGVTPYAATAENVVRGYSAGAGGGLTVVANGTAGAAPKPGDVVSFDSPRRPGTPRSSPGARSTAAATAPCSCSRRTTPPTAGARSP